jgi:integrase
MSEERRTRRSNGESSIYRDEAGVWHGKITVGRKPGGGFDRRHRRGKTRAEVVRKLAELERARDAGGVAAAGVRWTVEAWCRHYVEVVKGPALAPNTIRSYLGHVDDHIGPRIGTQPIGTLRVEHIEAMFAEMLRKGLSPATCERVRATLRGALTVAVRRDLLVRNVAALAQVPARADTESIARPLTAAEAQAILGAAGGGTEGARWSLALLGMRPGEVLGLDWSAVDLDAGRVQVRQQLVEVYPYRHGCALDDKCRDGKALRCAARVGGRMLTRPKSDAGRRIIALPAEVVAMLRAHRRVWVEQRLRAANAWQVQWGDLVFARVTGAPRDTAVDRKAWLALLAATGVEGRRLYDARHTAGTLLLDHGADLHQVKEQLGHSQISLTSRYYVHATERLREDTATRLGGALFGPMSGDSCGDSCR